MGGQSHETEELCRKAARAAHVLLDVGGQKRRTLRASHERVGGKGNVFNDKAKKKVAKKGWRDPRTKHQKKKQFGGGKKYNSHLHRV